MLPRMITRPREHESEDGLLFVVSHGIVSASLFGGIHLHKHSFGLKRCDPTRKAEQGGGGEACCEESNSYRT